MAAELKSISTLSRQDDPVFREGPKAIIGSLYYMPPSRLVCASRRLLMLICWLVVGLTASSALALDPTKAITQFVHTSWTEKDGVPTEVRALAQTTDGYLWLGTSMGLYHFDGVHFTRFEPLTGAVLPSTRVRKLLASRDGSLWIVWASGTVSHLRGGHLDSYSEQDGLLATSSLAEASDGTLIAATVKGLAGFKDGTWKDVGTEWGFPGRQARLVYFDKAGALWVLTEDRVIYLPAGQRHFIDPGEPAEQSIYFAEASDGVMWLSETSRSAHTVRRLGDQGPVTEIRVGASALLFDRDGSFWVGSAGDGLRRIAYPSRISGQRIAQFGPEAEQFTAKDGLSGAYVQCSFEDREGNIWFGTDKGLDRFRHSVFTVVPLPKPEIRKLILATSDGSLWSTSAQNTELYRISPQGLPEVVDSSFSFMGMCEDEAGAVWGAGLGILYRYQYQQRRSVDILLRGSIVPKYLVNIACDQAGGILLVDSNEGLLRFADGKLIRIADVAQMPFRWESVNLDRAGRIWVGKSGRVEVYDHGQSKLFSTNDGVPTGQIWAFFEDPAGHIWMGGEGGLSKFEDGHFRTISTSTGFPARSVFGLIQDDGGSWWITSDIGVLRVSAGELDQAFVDSGYRLHYEIFDSLDGLPGRPRYPLPGPALARTTDGRIWVSTDNGLAYVDPRRIVRNDVPPPVRVEAITANGVHYTSLDSLQLPPRIANLEIQYTALSLTIPERVRFRYMLEGVDPDWQDPGVRRTAYYTNLRPGDYQFRVKACNNDGVWNELGATLSFRITPAWYQTIWFRILYILLALFVIWMFYRLRLRQVARAMSTRFDERLAERTRIARELHDTLLQTVQGSKLVAEDALEKSHDSAYVLSSLEKLTTWLGQATQEGRAALNSLRTSTIDTDDLAAGLRRATEECVIDSSVAVKFSATGGRREMHPVARDEIYRIGYEAIRNAFEHSSATELQVDLNYAQDLTLGVKDNGTGIEPAVIDQGKEGHFGIQGMRERAERIGSKLTIASAPNSGTEMTLIVPGKVIFPKAHAGRFERVRNLFRRGHGVSDSE